MNNKTRYRAISPKYNWEGRTWKVEKEALADLEVHKDQFPDEDHSGGYIDHWETTKQPIRNHEAKTAIDLQGTESIPIGEPTFYNRTRFVGLGIGDCFNPIDLSEVKRGALDFEVQHTGGPSKTELEAVFVSNYESYNQVLEIDSNVSAAYLKIGAGSSSNFKYDGLFEKNTATIVLKARSLYTDFQLTPRTKLTEEAKSLLSNPKEFINRYGTRYISREDRVNAVIIEVRFMGLSNNETRSFRSSISGNAGIGKLSASASRTFNKLIKKVSSSRNVILKFWSTGGGGMSDLENFVVEISDKSEDPLLDIKKEMSKVLGKFNEATAIPSTVYVSSLAQFGLDTSAASVVFSRERSDALQSIKNVYENLDIEYDMLKSIKKGEHVLNSLHNGSIQDDINEFITSEEHEVLDTLKKLEQRHFNCKNNPDESSYVLPKIPKAISDHAYRYYLKPMSLEWKGRYRTPGSTILQNLDDATNEVVMNSDPVQRERDLSNILGWRYENNSFQSVVQQSYSLAYSTVEVWTKILKDGQEISNIRHGVRNEWFPLDVLDFEKQEISWRKEVERYHSSGEFETSWYFIATRKDLSKYILEIYSSSFLVQNHRIQNLDAKYNI